MKKKESNILYRRLVRSYLSSVISISLVLFLVGLAGLLVANAREVSNYFKENMSVSAILDTDVSDNEAFNVATVLKRYPFVKEVVVITKEEGTKEMKELLGDDFLELFSTNPIPASLDLFIKADYIVNDSLVVIKNKLEKLPQISEVIYHESLIELLNANIEKIGIVLSVFILLLLFISMVLINNTVRLNVYSKRFTIHTMRLVGATKGFIRRPFNYQAFFQGFISGLVAVLFLLGVLILVRNEFNQLFMLFDYKILIFVLSGVVVTGIFICLISTTMIVNRLVSIHKDKLYY
jgi:cell division transport system permease protein